MSLIFNDNFEIRAPKPFEERIAVNTINDLTLLDSNYNWENMYVWVRSKKNFYYKKDNTLGTNINDWDVFKGYLVNSTDIIYDGLTGSSAIFIGTTLSLSLPNVISASTIGSSSSIPIITFDNKGRIINVTSSNIFFDSNRYTSRSGLPEVLVGSNNLNDFINTYFFPDRNPILNLYTDTTSTYREIGDSSNLTFTYSIVKKTYGISSITLNGDNIIPDTSIANDSSLYNTNFTSTYSYTTPTAGTYTNTIVDSKGNTVTKNIVVTYNKSIYSGLISGTAPSIDTNTIINNFIDYKITKTYSYTLTNLSNYVSITGSYFFVAIPTDIALNNVPKFNVNGFYDNDWTCVTVSNALNRFGVVSGDYQVWYSNNKIYSNYYSFNMS